MQQSGMFRKHWSVKWSAIVAIITYFIIFGVFMYSVSEYMKTEEMVKEFEAGLDKSAVWVEMIAGTFLTTSPLFIGIVLNLIALFAKKRMLLLAAGIFYFLNGILDFMFMLYCLAPMILAFVAFYQVNKTPALRPPRLR